MSLRNYGWLFGTTLLLGGIGGMLMGLVTQENLYHGSIANFFMGLLMNLLLGLTTSIVAQMGFFAYMMFNYLVLNSMKSKALRKNIQIFFILFAFFDMVYLRYIAFGQGGSLLPYFVEPVLLLGIALITAYAKVKMTNPTAWVPTVFFIFVVTSIEWLPALKQDDFKAIAVMVVPLLFCNVWQILQLHRLTTRTEQKKRTKTKTKASKSF
ncbi:KinB-signaling pathway activation protein [Brevibacillus laterosporus]|uniref:KinB-signaling pathway activation protein n=1 Tax=Brevibacillus laterosporus TaxID=1465 RepID=UPI002653D041|nr:KinB-signaling pathway activation protein [Brevibacillus laterosporus]MDN9012331.1 KinB-signaling pathway activation protein [Brevibacillus laterosporus]MDO0943427.1 KinB-signaling pathway activation protein [Brevibacillus laterosporus]